MKYIGLARFQNYLQNVLKNFTYLNSIQNDVLSSFKPVILNNIRDGIQRQLFAVMADETSDVNRHGQYYHTWGRS